MPPFEGFKYFRLLIPFVGKFDNRFQMYMLQEFQKYCRKISIFLTCLVLPTLTMGFNFLEDQHMYQFYGHEFDCFVPLLASPISLEDKIKSLLVS